MKAENRALAAFAAACAASLLLALVYAASLPLFIGAERETDGPAHVPPAADPLDMDVAVLKLAMPFYRSHPLYQLVSNELPELLGLAPAAPFLLEVYPAGTLGAQAELFAGLSLGTLELCVADDGLFGLVPGLRAAWTRERPQSAASGGFAGSDETSRLLRDRDIVALAWFESGRRQRWSVSKDAASTRGIDSIELTYAERRFQGWSGIAERVVAADLYAAPVFILMGAGPYYSLGRSQRDAVREAAERLARDAEALMRAAESEIRYETEREYLR